MDFDFTPESRIAISGDWHGDTEYGRRVIRSLPADVRVLIHLGDFGFKFERSFLRGLTQQAAQRNVHVMFVDGNHENFDWLLAQPVDDDGVRRLTERVWHLPRGFRWEWAGVKFLALGGAYSVDRRNRKEYRSWWPQEEITYSEALAVANGEPVDVMITHDCPDGVDIPDLESWRFSPHALIEAQKHRELLRGAVNGASPRWLFHGHYHVCYEADLELETGPCHIVGLSDNLAPVSGNTRVASLSLFAR